jgi:hypothetical protein
MKDKYDQQIDKLLNAPNVKRAIQNDWEHAIGLFQFATPTGKVEYDDALASGCLTMIRRSTTNIAYTQKLTEAIRADERLPKNWGDIEPHHLPVFAEWQRRLDKEIRHRHLLGFFRFSSWNNR